MPLSPEIVFATVTIVGTLIVVVVSARRREWVRVSAWVCLAVYSVLALETSIASKQWDRVKSRDRNATYNKMSVAELAKLVSRFCVEEPARPYGR